MSGFTHTKYRAFAPVKMTNRQWPDQIITSAPKWCSVDLRDGNQALIEPMSVSQKQEMFKLLVKVGFKEIEVGFPAASQPDFDFVRWLIEEEQIPDDVTIQVLTQAREALIERTFESLKGAKRAIVHVYNSTSIVQREQVFRLDKQGIIDIAVNGARHVKRCAEQATETEWTFEYSPESFTGTEIEFSVDVVNSVIDVWQPTPNNKAIINLPATVEVSTPNIYADQIEWFCSNVAKRDSIEISVHTHNDRGCGVAAAELAVMAGAERVEGTLLGNGERTGNMDVVTMAMNLYSQGVDPELNLEDMDEIVRVIKSCTQLPVHPRHPYAGELVYTAFSGSHQDAIKKCLDIRKDKGEEANAAWEVAYLPIDPTDLGRSYQEVIRVNSQSGKGGVAYSLEQQYGLQLPRWMQMSFSNVVQRHAEQTASIVSSESMKALFDQTYMAASKPFQLGSYSHHRNTKDQVTSMIQTPQGTFEITGQGHGAIDAFTQALSKYIGIKIDVQEFHEHALTQGSDASAISYLKMNIEDQKIESAAIHEDTLTATMNAIICAVNQYHADVDQAAA